MNKLSPLTIILLGVSIAIVALSWGFFREKMPNDLETDYQHTYRDQVQAEANKLNAAKERRQTAINMVNAKAREWAAVATTKTPAQGLANGSIDLAVNAWQLAIDTRKYRNNLQRLVNAQVKKGGIVVLNGPDVPMPPTAATGVLAGYFNYPAFDFPIVIFDFGTVTVRGTYKQIMDNVRAWTAMPNYLAIADGLSIQGTSPILTASYNVSIVGFIRGKEIFPPVPEGGGGGGGAPGPGGAPGGAPGGGGRAGGGRAGGAG